MPGPTRSEKIANMKTRLNGVLEWVLIGDYSICGRLTRALLLMAYIAALGLLGMSIRILSTDLHVLFWLGKLPNVALVFTFMSTAILFTGILYAKYVAIYREFEMESQRLSRTNVIHTGNARVSMCSQRNIRLLLWIIALMACLGMFAGQEVLRQGLTRVKSMSSVTTCGSLSPSTEIEQKQKELDTFQSKCQQTPANRAKPVSECPGYATSFPPPSPYALYIQALERDFSCAGFCKPERKQLFDPSAKTPAKFGSKWAACAPQLGRHLKFVAVGVGGASLVLGAIVIIFTFMLYMFDEL